MQILDGKAVAGQRRQQIKQQVDHFTSRTGRQPGLAVILVGDNPASQVYVANKIKACAEVGIASVEKRLQADVSPGALKAVIDQLNRDPAVDGILLQLPLPKPLDSDQAIQWIDPRKDADCLTAENLGRLWIGQPRTRPCTPWGVMVILEHYKMKVEGWNAVVIGRSHIVGKPMAHLLTEANATVTVCHSRTRNLREHTSKADLCVVAAGQSEFLGAADFRQDSVIIDVGMHRKTSDKAPGKTSLCGDVRFQELEGHARAATPVPGGVGPMTITMLLENTLKLAEQRGF